jgi:hypothetical protein
LTFGELGGVGHGIINYPKEGDSSRKRITIYPPSVPHSKIRIAVSPIDWFSQGKICGCGLYRTGETQEYCESISISECPDLIYPASVPPTPKPENRNSGDTFTVGAMPSADLAMAAIFHFVAVSRIAA